MIFFSLDHSLCKMSPSTFTSRINYEAEHELEKSTSFKEPRPRILSMDNFTAKDAAEADPAHYRLIDVVKTIVYLEAGIDSVKNLFGKGTKPYEFSRFDQCDTTNLSSFQNKTFWKAWTHTTLSTKHIEVSLTDRSSHVCNILMNVQIGIWTQVKMKREINLDDDSESWTLEDESLRPMAHVVFTMDEDSVCTPISCSILPNTTDSIQTVHIDTASKIVTMMLLHAIAALKEQKVPKTLADQNSPKRQSPHERKRSMVGGHDKDLRKARSLVDLRAILNRGSERLVVG